jgi:hypothetical protein
VRMAVEITPEPSDEERKAILEALAEEGSGGSAAAPQAWGDPDVVEPGDPRQHERDE